MGYRSHVSAAITAPSRDFFVSMVAELKLSGKLNDEDPMFDKENNTDWGFFKLITVYDVVAPAWAHTRSDGSVRPEMDVPLVVMEFVTEDDLKWYDGYAYPTLWKEMTEIAERHGLPWQICRIGEDSEDVEDKSSFDSEPLRNYLELLGLLTGSPQEKDDIYESYKAVLEDGQNVFRMSTVIEANEQFAVKGQSSMRDLLAPKAVS